MPDGLKPARLIGRRLLSASIGWHVHGNTRTPERLLIEVDGIGWIETYAPGNGSLRLDLTEPVQDFDMEQYGRFEFTGVHPGHPLAPVIGERIDNVQRIVWVGTDVGLELSFGSRYVVVVNDFDEVFVSDGPLPPACADEAHRFDV